MHAPRARRTGRIIIAATAALALAASAAQADVGPKLLSPAAGKAFEVGARPTFTASDRGDAFNGTVWLTISKFRRTDRHGQIKQSDGGTFTSMRRRRGGKYAYTPPDYSFPGWFMATPGTYYWQAYRIECSSGSSDCKQEGPVVRFKVR